MSDGQTITVEIHVDEDLVDDGLVLTAEKVEAALARAFPLARSSGFSVVETMHEPDELTFVFTGEQLAALRRLGTTYATSGKGDASEVILHLVQSACDGLRRPGSWERGWIQQAFGEVPAIVRAFERIR